MLILLLTIACSTPTTPAPDAPTETPAATEAASTVVYACPMHPEVTSSTPGSCSKCGMDLVKQDAPAGH